MDTCVYAYNMSVQESTCFSPFEVMSGRKATMPVDINIATKTPEDRLQKCLNAEKLSPSKVEKMESQRQELLQQVKANILQAQEKPKEYYDRKRANPFAYTVGAKVLKKDFLRKKRKGGKMDARFLGPYIITKNLGKGLYFLELIEDPTVVVHRVNWAHLKPYQTPCQSPESSTHTGDSPQTSQNQSSPHSPDNSYAGDSPPRSNSPVHQSPDNSHAGDFPPTSHSGSSHQTSFEDSFPPLPPPVPLFRPFKRQLDPTPGSSSPRKPPDSHSQSSLNQNTPTHYHLYLRTSFHHHQQLAHL